MSAEDASVWSADELVLLGIGKKAGLGMARAEARVEAFAAIRRAAQVAREYDKDAQLKELSLCADHANGIREAIRAAIRTDTP